MLDFTFPLSTDPELITKLCLSAQDTLRLETVDGGRGELYQHASQRVHELMHHRSHQPEF